ARLDLAIENGLKRRLLVVEYTRWPRNDWILQPRNFGHSAFRRQIALENGQMPLLVQGLVESANNLLLGAGCIGYVGQLLGNRLPGNSDAIAIDQAGIKQHFHDLRHAARLMEIDRQILAAGLEVADNGYALTHTFKIIDGPFNAGRMRDGQDMQDGVG